MARTFLALTLLIMLGVMIGSAQPRVDSLRRQLESRFEILPIANGVVLRPKFKTSVRSIELAGQTIAIDGTAVTGAELGERLGSNSDLVLQLSYLDDDARRALARGELPTSKPETAAGPAVSQGPGPDDGPAERPRRPRARRREDVVRIGGSVTIDADEQVHGDVVVIGGAAAINGEVDGEVVVVAGSASFGPQADVRGDVTVVGGTLMRDPGAEFRGRLQEVGFGGVPWRGEWSRNRNWDWMSGIYPVARLTTTLVRVGLLVLLTALVLFLARGPVEQIADRVAADPVKSWFVGFLAEMLFIPVMIMTAILLVITVVGIPLLVLLPVAVVAGGVAMLVGFTAVAFQIGRMLQERFEALRTSPYMATFVGILLIVSPVLLARLVGLTGELAMVWPIAAVGFLFEYMAWTAGLGAAALARWGRPTAPPQAMAVMTEGSSGSLGSSGS
jgi:hypothetical protein